MLFQDFRLNFVIVDGDDADVGVGVGGGGGGVSVAVFLLQIHSLPSYSQRVA